MFDAQCSGVPSLTNYDPHDWTSHLLDLEGSLVREIIGRVLACVVWATVVTLLPEPLEENDHPEPKPLPPLTPDGSDPSEY